MAEAIDAAMQCQEPTDAQAGVDHMDGEAGCQQLPPGDDTMLARGQGRDDTVVGEFTGHMPV
jgi:peptidyl-tRNA hydrolase